MGATEFFASADGETASEAFYAAREEAKYQSGHGGYTGTIAEKHEFKSATSEVFKDREAAAEYADGLICSDSHWCSDKWGPAACVRFYQKEKVKYLFFGVASC